MWSRSPLFFDLRNLPEKIFFLNHRVQNLTANGSTERTFIAKAEAFAFRIPPFILGV